MHTLTKETLDESRLRNSVDEETFLRGQELYASGQAEVLTITPTSAVCSVTDRRALRVEILVKDNFLYLRCDCVHASRGLICEHELAACFATRAQLVGLEPPKWRTQLEQLARTVRSSALQPANPFLLVFSLQRDAYNLVWKLVPYQMPGRLLPNLHRNPDSIRDPANLMEVIRLHGLVHRFRSSNQAFDPAGCLNCSREVVTLANVIQERARIERSHSLQPPLEDYLPLLANLGAPIFLGNSKDPIQKILSIRKDVGELGLHLALDDLGLQVSPRLIAGGKQVQIDPENFEILHREPLWLLVGDQLIELKDPAWVNLITSFGNVPELRIPTDSLDEFLDNYYLRLARQVELEGELVEWQDLHENPIARLYLSDEGGELQAELRFVYGDVELPYNPELPAESLRRLNGSWTLMRVHRQSGREEALYQQLIGSRYGLKRFPSAPKPGVFRLRARVHPVDFLLNKVPLLAKDGFEVYGEEQLTTARVNRSTPSISFNISSGIDWFDVQAVVNFGELAVSLSEMRKAMRKRQRYIKLSDGSIGEIPEEWFEKYKHLFSLAEYKGEHMRLSRFHLPVIDQTLEAADCAHTDKAFDEQRQQLARMRSMDFTGIHPASLPRGFYGELRPYQKAGYDWLHFLRDYQFGGILADDMGLGKTIQALAFFQSLYHNGQAPPSSASLLVVPRSLLINWQREAARFTPKVRVLEYFASNRKKDLKIFEKVDLVITTYGVMLRDIEFLHGYTFHYAILDESQSIKNPLSQTARAARLLQAEHRLVLTGTPIENSTVELWSQFAFLNPGLLGSLEYFKNHFGSPIERQGDQETAELLRQMVYPFILRRTKDQVAPELPPRSERVLYCDMEPAQRKLYNRTRDYYRGMLLGMIEEGDLNHSRMQILEGLLRLRQICNHPRLFDKNFRGASSKFDLLFETLETLRLEGHKVLVFSQFVSMLSLVRAELDKEKVAYAYLDGSTTDRQAVVDRFQEDPALPLFLISLKAGGLGLNLTAADYVIHIDPWWNPAVEMQASDRTHRIGQDKPVFVYKLITRDSVEEKIVQLQERKKELVDQIITTEASYFKSLTEQDIEALFSG